ncbi:uncharacterized protein [Antedon mediterranea]|uniref:uncharacterized protein n=1 Tax=Antedon mediterranea TaxID=105859 RepID=UPI003AF522C7
MTNLDMNMFWIRSVYEHTVAQHASGNPISIDGRVSIESPPISLVATHMDKLPSRIKWRNRKKVEGMFNEMFDKMEGMKYAAHVDREMYMVDNTVKSHAGIKKLKKNIGKYMQAMGMKEVPINWLNFQEILQDIGKTKVCILYNEASRIGTECGISEEAIIVAITYMNDIGKIMYSNKDEKLRNTVITNLHTMIQMLTTVITVFPPAIKDMEMKRRWKRLKDEGILEEKVLRYLWQNQDEGNFEIFVEVMRVFRLLFEKKTKEEGNREFLVPCRMTVDNETSLQVTKDDRQRVSIYLTPTDFLSDAVYHTLVVAFLELMTETGSFDQNVFRNRSDFEFKDHKVSLGAVEINRKKEKPHALKLEIYRRTIDRYNTETDGTKPKVVSERRQLKPDVCFEVEESEPEADQAKLSLVPSKNEEDEPVLEVVQVRVSSPGHQESGANEANQLVPVTETKPESEPGSVPRTYKNQQVNKMTDLNEHFKDLKANLSKHYAGNHYRLVKLCLYDHLPLGDFEGRGLTAHNLFNKLQIKGYIEPSNVKLLLEVAKLTEFKVAEHLVLE